MEKIRINFTILDYYSYMGINPYYSKKERMLQSIPEEFKKVGYNIKFKTIKSKWMICYRIHMSLKMQEGQLKKILERYENILNMNNISYKVLMNKFN